MSKKILSVLVAIMMVVSMLAVSASAVSYEDDETAAEYTQDWALSEPVDNGDGTWTVDVILTTNYATGPIEFVLTSSDEAVADIDSYELGDAIPDSYNATIYKSPTDGKFTIFPDTSSGDNEAVEIDGVIATVVYTYSGAGSATIAIDDDAKSKTNPAGTLSAPRMSDGNLATGSYIVGQAVTVGDSVIIGGGEAEAPTLGVIDGTAGVIDTTRQDMYCDESEVGLGDATFTGYIYGVEVEPGYEETIDTVFEVIGDGELEIIGTEAGSEVGTGTVVNVLDTNGDVVESYVLVVFGDVNGDGMVDTSDSYDIELHDAYMYEMSSNGMRMEYMYQVFAGDVNCDAMVDTSDSYDIELHDSFMYEMGSDGMRMYQADVIANIA